MTTLDELRSKLPDAPAGDHWISDPVGERFGLISFSQDDEPVAQARELIGKAPGVGGASGREDRRLGEVDASLGAGGGVGARVDARPPAGDPLARRGANR